MSSSLNKRVNQAWQRLRQSYNIQPMKYDKKGFAKYVGYFLLISYFTLLPAFYASILPYLLEHLPHKLIMGIGSISLNISILLCYNLIMVLIYRAKRPFFQQYRVNSKPWPWQENYQEWIKLLKQSLKTVALNSIVIGGILGLHDSWGSNYKVSMEEIPDTKTLVWQFFFFLLMEDLFFYIGHSTFHRPQFYWIHKKHHEYGNTVTIAAQYAHPIEHIFGNSLPTWIGYKILSQFYPVHTIAIWVFMTFRIIQTCDGHSGYEWGWSQSELLPFSAGSAYHNFHHSHNVGNYGSFFKIWDSLFGTNVEFVKYKAKLEGQKQLIKDTPEAKKLDSTKAQ